ncbi:MAG TPA: hypothetical protein ENL03_00340, partial [Phycisphaerae bacterium]|nr:hypothetical protein [Phycisphaerae bacterium]
MAAKEEKTKGDSRRKRRKRRWRRLLIFLVIVAALVFSTPYVLSTGTALNWVLGIYNGRIAGSVHVDDLSLNWLGETNITGLTVKDPRGRVVMHTRKITLADGLWGLVTDS